ncbi:MAG: hypothetical protein DMF80_04300 [Acidobacteria bacterium]|nr:MAG: hypothetical protein DMF80_04300 [Acidobacteriota bacterium]
MKKASWIVLAVAGTAFIVISLVSAIHAYNKGDDYGIGGVRVSKVAAGREAVATALRGIRGTSAAFATAYGVLFLAIVLTPYRRGDVWAWWALFAGTSTVLAIALLRIPFLNTTLGVSAGATQFTLTMAGLLLDARRLTSRNQ